MGVVYEVADPQGRRLALKRLRTESNTDDKLRLRRIGRELEALGRIQHPGVVRALDSGWDSGTFYIVMELVPSASLGTRIQRQGPLPPSEAAALCLGLAQTLHALHGQGILHRDVKPDNVLVDDQGHPRLTDLGLVQLYDEQEQLTQTGSAVGTPGYCAPELLSRRRGQKPTAAVDVYGLGATLYALLTGHAPYEGGSHYEIAVKTVEGSPTPPSRRLGEGGSGAEQRAEVERFDALVLRCLATDPSDRYPSAQAVADALEGLMRSEPEAAGEGDDEPQANLLLPVAVVVALGLFLAALYVALSPAEEPELIAATRSSPSASTPAPRPSTAPLAASPSPPSAASEKRSAAPSARVTEPTEVAVPEDFLAEPGRASKGPLQVRGLDDLRTLGGLAEYVWKGRGASWVLSREPSGFVGLQSVPQAGAGTSIRYFELARTKTGQSFSAQVTVEVDIDQEGVLGGLIYGRTDRRDYYLIGISNVGTRFVKHRSRTGLEDRITGRLPAGPHSFGIKEAGRRLEISVDGRMILGLGGAADPEGRVGVFVVGAGRANFKDFLFELR
jgi:serine/threonine protein kinase